MRSRKMIKLNRKTLPPKHKLFRKEIRRKTRKKRLQITQKMPANDKEDTPKIQCMHKPCLQRGKPNYETIKINNK